MPSEQVEILLEWGLQDLGQSFHGHLQIAVKLCAVGAQEIKKHLGALTHWWTLNTLCKPCQTLQQCLQKAQPLPHFSSLLHLWLWVLKNISSPGIPCCQQNSKGRTSGGIQISDTGMHLCSLSSFSSCSSREYLVKGHLEYFQSRHFKTWKNWTLCSMFNS